MPGFEGCEFGSARHLLRYSKICMFAAMNIIIITAIITNYPTFPGERIVFCRDSFCTFVVRNITVTISIIITLYFI